MEQAGFPSPSTVASFLRKRELTAGAVMVVDEAGQIGGRPMLELLRLARERNARVILSDDTRQHGAIEASDALLAIERRAGVQPVDFVVPFFELRIRAISAERVKPPNEVGIEGIICAFLIRRGIF